MALISEMASFSASTAPVSEIAIVPVKEWRMPIVTLSSVTARPVVSTAAGRRGAKCLRRKQTDHWKGGHALQDLTAIGELRIVVVCFGLVLKHNNLTTLGSTGREAAALKDDRALLAVPKA